MFDKLTQHLHDLAVARRNHDEIKSKLTALIEEVKAKPEYVDDKKKADELANLVEALEKLVREETVNIYRSTGNKTPIEKIAYVGVETTYTWDQKDALPWAQENDKTCIVTKVDEKLFNDKIASLVKAKKELPAFIRIEQTPKGKIGSDLSAYLP